MSKPKKGDRLIYTGRYAHEMPEVYGQVDPIPAYPPGAVVAFRNYGQTVTVLLDKVEGETEDLYADWPIDKVVPAACAPGGCCLIENGTLVRTDDGCPTHSKRPRKEVT